MSSRFLGSEPRGNKHKTARVGEKSLLVIALLLLGAYGTTLIYQSVLSRIEVWRFTSQQRVNQPGPEPTHRLIWPAQEETNPNLWSPGRVMAFWESLSRQFAPPIGVLRVPKINLEVAVLEGTDEWTLNRAVGRIIGTARMGEQGNVGIAGHRDGFFRGLKELQVGDTLHLVTPEKTEIYTVDRILIVDSQAVHLLGPRPDPSITLVTCYPFYYVGSAPGDTWSRDCSRAVQTRKSRTFPWMKFNSRRKHEFQSIVNSHCLCYFHASLVTPSSVAVGATVN